MEKINRFKRKNARSDNSQNTKVLNGTKTTTTIKLYLTSTEKCAELFFIIFIGLKYRSDIVLI